MNPESQALIGLWDVSATGIQSEVLLRPDGQYSVMLSGQSQAHWGTWSVQENGGQPILVMQIMGAQPLSLMTPQPEMWAIQSIQPNQITLWGAVMVRHVMPPAQPAFQPAELPPMSDAVAPTPFTPTAQTMLPPNYVAPPPVAMPAFHSTPINTQWRAPAAPAQPIDNEARKVAAATDIADREADRAIQKMYSDFNSEVVQDNSDRNLALVAANHAQAKKFNTWQTTGMVLG